MWGRKRRHAEQSADVLAAQAAQQQTEDIIAHVDSEEAELIQIVTRLAHRSSANHFGEALELAMEKRR